MDQLVEIFRRLTLAGIWILALGFAAIFAIPAFNEGKSDLLFLSVGIIVVAWVVTKIINWIFIR